MSVRASNGINPPDGRHWRFRAPDRGAVDAFHAAGVAAGGRSVGAPGLRPDHHAACHAAFPLDPDANRPGGNRPNANRPGGNRGEAVCHRPAAPPR